MNRARRSVEHGMQGVFVFVLLGLFALMSTLMVLLGAQMYRSTVANATDNNNQRVLSAYLRSMVRAEDGLGAVRLEEYDGTKAIALYEEIGDSQYVTWIYLYDGQLREQFTSAGYDFDPEDGTPIAEAGRFEPSLENGLLTVELINGANEVEEVQVALRCAQGTKE